MSQREAAGRAGISSERWRHIVSGKRSDGTPFTPLPETLAKLALAVDVPARAFEKIKRPDIARVIRALTAVPDTLTDERQETLLGHLIVLREQFGEAVFQAAVDAVTKDSARNSYFQRL